MAYQSGNKLGTTYRKSEFSEDPLDQCLFEPPDGFRRVVHLFPGEQLSWNDQLLFRWQQLQEWLDSLF